MSKKLIRFASTLIILSILSPVKLKANTLPSIYFYVPCFSNQENYFRSEIELSSKVQKNLPENLKNKLSETMNLCFPSVYINHEKLFFTDEMIKYNWKLVSTYIFLISSIIDTLNFTENKKIITQLVNLLNEITISLSDFLNGGYGIAVCEGQHIIIIKMVTEELYTYISKMNNIFNNNDDNIPLIAVNDEIFTDINLFNDDNIPVITVNDEIFTNIDLFNEEMLNLMLNINKSMNEFKEKIIKYQHDHPIKSFFGF